MLPPQAPQPTIRKRLLSFNSAPPQDVVIVVAFQLRQLESAQTLGARLRPIPYAAAVTPPLDSTFFFSSSLRTFLTRVL